MRKLTLPPEPMGDDVGALKTWIRDAFREIENASQQEAIQDVAASGATLSTIADAEADTFPYYTGPTSVDMAALTAKAREFLALASEADMRAFLDVVAQNALINAIAGLNAAGAGLIAKTGAGTAALRSLTTTAAAGLAITNSDGVAGDPVIDLDIPSMTAEAATVSADDYAIIYDASVPGYRKVLLKNIGLGAQTAYIPAGALTSRTTNGAANGKTETTTNKVMLVTKDFNKDTAQYAQWHMWMPKSWNAGTVTAIFIWTHSAGATFGVAWNIQAVSIGDDSALDAAFGTAVTVTDTGGTNGRQYISAETGAITVASAAAEAPTYFQVYRDPTHGSDNLDADAKLIAVVLKYVTSANNDT